MSREEALNWFRGVAARIGRAYAVIRDALDLFFAEDGFGVASHVTLAALTSLFPFLIFVAALAGFTGAKGAANEATRLIFNAWPAAVAEPIADEVKSVLTAQRGGLVTLGGLLALYFSTSAIDAARLGLNRAYGFKEERPWWLLRLHAAAFTIIGSLALVGLAFLLVLGPSLWRGLAAWAPGIGPFRAVVNVLRLVVASVLLAGATFAAHLWLPAGRLRLAEIAPGVAATLIASVIFSEAFGAYLREYASRYVSTYADLASVMVALVYLNSLSTIFIFGGAFNAAIMRARRPAPQATPEPPVA